MLSHETEGPNPELSQMTAHLVAAERRAKTLAELNRLMAQGRDPLALAQRAVDLVMRATGATGSFVYLWDPAIERLILRVATTGRQAAHVGQVHLRLGEGITGWTALMRQTVVVQDDISRDPRFVSFPFLDEDKFRSMVAVPTVASGSELLGTFSIWSTCSNAFDEHAVSLATEVGGLLANGLLQAQTVEDLRRQSAAAQFLLTIPADGTSSLSRCLDALAASVREQVDAVLCIVDLATAPAAGALRPGMAFAEHVDNALTVRSRLARSRADVAALASEAADGLEKVTTSFGHLGSLGTVTCYRGRPFSTTDLQIVEALAAQSGVLIAAMQNTNTPVPLAGSLAALPTLGLVEDMLLDLGWRPGPLHPVVLRVRASHIRSAAVFERILDSVQRLCGAFEGIVIVPSAPTISLLVTHVPEHWPRFVQALRAMIEKIPSDTALPTVAGVGPLTNELAFLRAGLEHAEAALQWADLLGEAVVQFDDVTAIAQMPRTVVTMGPDLRDILQRFRELARYDVMHGTDLSRTLDAYFANGCSMTESAERMYIHRNTLRQRLARIENILGCRPLAMGDWTTVALAARLNHDSLDLARSTQELR